MLVGSYKVKSVSFHTMLLVAFVFLLVTSALPIILISFYKDKGIISNLGNDLIDHISMAAIEKTSNYFLPASIMVQMSSKLTELGAVSCENSKETEMFTIGVLKSYPQIAMFYYGDEHGNFVRAWRRPDGSIESRIIKASATPPVDRFVFRNASLEITDVEESNIIDFDPRLRPWYVGAKKMRGNFWTDMYVSFRNRKPAITSSHPNFDKDGKLVGVWAMDIELDEISNFLKTQKIGRRGIELVINDKNEVVAYPELSLIIRQGNGGLRPVSVKELGVESLSVAYQKYEKTGRGRSLVESDGKTYFASFKEFPELFPMRWKIAVVVPEEDFTGGARQEMIAMLGISSATLGLAVLLAFVISRGITSPVRLIAEATGKIKSFELDEKIHIPSRMKEIQLMRDAISSMQKGLHAFRRYVPAELVRQLINTGEGAQLGGHKQELTVFFSDISGFTSIAEVMPPEKLMLHLSEYFTELTRILTHHGATVDKYIGDAIMAFWGAPVHDDNHAIRACEASLACHEKVNELNRRWLSEGKSAFVTRIGLSTGETVVGNVGSTERMNYTVMGDNVNMANRLEGANKLYGTRIIVSRRTYEVASRKFLFRPLGLVAVKGRSEEQEVFELVGRRSDSDGRISQLCDEFSRGLNAYLSQDWEEACAIFSALSIRYPEDAPTSFYLRRCVQFHDHPPGDDWQGIVYQTTK